MIYTTHSPEETHQIAAQLANQYRQGGVFALSGQLGVGKTTFIQGFAQALGITQKLLSPTFILMREYSLPYTPEGRLIHLDLYRLENSEQTESLGLGEIITNPHNIVLIEWAEKLQDKLPKDAILIKFEYKGEKLRQIEVIEN